MKYELINIQDLFIVPLYLGLLISLGFFLRKKITRNHPVIRKYFMPALYLRILGCFLSGIMYQYYYHGGDTFVYYNGSVAFWDIFWDNPIIYLESMLNSPQNYSMEIKQYFLDTDSEVYLRNSSTSIILKIGGFLSLFTFKSYYSIGLIITFFSFLGCWKLFEVFYQQYPHLHKRIAFSVLFIPSVFFWGAAGLMKDTVIIAALGYTIWAIYNLFILGTKRTISLVYFFIGLYLILIIKTYIAYALFPALTVWIFLRMNANINNKIIRRLVFPILIAVGVISAFFLFQTMLLYGDDKFSPENVLVHASNVQRYHKDVSERAGGVAYDLGEYEPTLGGIFKLIPASINVALFRPYLWEARKAILVPAAIESLLTLILTIFIVLKIGIFKIIRITLSDSNVLFCLIFSLIFAFAMGFSSYNFGALARYKIPALPFYFIAITIIYDSSKRKIKSKYKRNQKF